MLSSKVSSEYVRQLKAAVQQALLNDVVDDTLIQLWQWANNYFSTLASRNLRWERDSCMISLAVACDALRSATNVSAPKVALQIALKSLERATPIRV